MAAKPTLEFHTLVFYEVLIRPVGWNPKVGVKKTYLKFDQLTKIKQKSVNNNTAAFPMGRSPTVRADVPHVEESINSCG